VKIPYAQKILMAGRVYTSVLCARAWFVVELCESIKALKIQMANFELYSSSPKEFRQVPDTYHGRSVRYQLWKISD
jgi:hypothetical protein